MKSRSGEAIALVLVVVALLGLGTWALKPAWFPGASKRAANSTKATAQVEATTNAQGASAAASVAKIGEANAVAPASPSKDFITREIPVALARLPAPDPTELLAAEHRRVAVMEGNLAESRRLYESAAKQSAELQRERDEALAARRAADLQLEKSAAVEHARTMQLMGAIGVVVILGAGWLYTKVYSVGPDTLGKIAADIRAGVKPIEALSTHTGPRLHERVRRAAKLAAELKDE